MATTSRAVVSKGKQMGRCVIILEMGCKSRLSSLGGGSPPMNGIHFNSVFKKVKKTNGKADVVADNNKKRIQLLVLHCLGSF